MVPLTYIKLTAAVLLLNVMTVFAAEQTGGLIIGIAPFLPVKTMVQNYAPLRDYLQIKLNEPITIVSAPDYETYYKCIQKHDYQIIITNASSAYVSYTDSLVSG